MEPTTIEGSSEDFIQMWEEAQRDYMDGSISQDTFIGILKTCMSAFYAMGIEPPKPIPAFVFEKEKSEKMADYVNHPPHYQAKDESGIECIDAIHASMDYDEFCGYLRGNVIKYIFRYDQKNALQDLQKAEWYLKRLISEVSKTSAIPDNY